MAPRPVVIGIAGGSGSGKTTVQRRVIDAFGQDGLTPVAVERLENWWRAEFRRD